MGKQEPVQAERLGLIGHQDCDRGRQSDGLGAQGAANVRIAGARRVALVEHQVDRVERGGQALGQRLVARHPERDPRSPDLRLRAYQALRHGGLGDEEGVGDLGRRKAAYHPQRQRHLRIGRERRMTAGEDEPQPLVGHARGHGSSPSGSSSSVKVNAASAASCALWSRRTRSWRSRSMARLRATATIHAAGSRGTPARGQRSSAVVNASCTASSARSQSPTARISAATARPKCSRNRRSTAPAAGSWLRTPRPPRKPRPAARRPRSPSPDGSRPDPSMADARPT
jgi:hypothetical protein